MIAGRTRVLILVVFLAGCSSTRSGRNVPAAPLTLAQFADGQWVFRSDSVVTKGLVRLLSDPDAPVRCEANKGASRYEITLSDQGSRMTLDGPDVFYPASRAASDGRRTVFNVSTMTGGRFVVRQVDAGLQGELTIFGSGVPVMEGLRGPVLPRRNDR